jgi:hypothetical protein
MSTYYSSTIFYQCVCDCTQTGCPKHKMRIAYHATSDTISVEIDGESAFVFDDNQLDAIVKLYQEKREK